MARAQEQWHRAAGRDVRRLVLGAPSAPDLVVLPGLGAPGYLLRRSLLVLRGRHDRLCAPDWAQRLADPAPDGRLAVVPRAHTTPWAHAEQTASALGEAAR